MPVVPAQQPSDNNSIQQNGVSGDLANVSKVKVTIRGVSKQYSISDCSDFQLEELQQELDTQTELASSRLIELQEMNEKNKTLAAELEGAQVKVYDKGIVIFCVLVDASISDEVCASGVSKEHSRLPGLAVKLLLPTGGLSQHETGDRRTQAQVARSGASPS